MKKQKQLEVEEQIISFETAKLAREKGFNEITRYHWEEGTDGHGPGLFESDEELRNMDLMSTYIKDGKSYGEWSAPTQSLLQKWLREAKRTYVFVTLDSSANEINTKWVYNTSSLHSKVTLYDTYEEALEAGLYEALSLI